jgi:hypothetical protein
MVRVVAADGSNRGHMIMGEPSHAFYNENSYKTKAYIDR